MREKLIELLNKVQDMGVTVIPAGMGDRYDHVWNQKVADHLIANDVVPVVRCKDCKHNEDCIRRIQFWGRNPVLELNTTEYHPLDFCSYGERRTDG